MAKGKLNVASRVDLDTNSSGIGFVLEVDGDRLYHGGSFIGGTSCGAANYNALVWGLDNAFAASVDDLELMVDDKDMASQLQGNLRVRNEGLRPLYTQAQILFRRIGRVDIKSVEPSENDLAAALALEGIEDVGMVGNFLRRPAQKQQLFDMSRVPEVFSPSPIHSSKVMEEYLRTGNVGGAQEASADEENPAEKEDEQTLPADDASNEPQHSAGQISWEELDRLTSPDLPSKAQDYGQDIEGEQDDGQGSEQGGEGEPFEQLSAFARTAHMVETAFDDDSPRIPVQRTASQTDAEAKIGEGALEQGQTGAGMLKPPSASKPSGQDAACGTKTVLVGVTGCIAAYKACELVRTLQKLGHRVKVVMTENATHFVGASTFKALTSEKVAVSLFDEPSDPVYHISLAREADCMVIAPCTANVIAKLARGVADDLLTTTALALDGVPLLVAPAMNEAMWEAQATRENTEELASRGVVVVGPKPGALACGEEGEGRLAEVDAIASAVCEALKSRRRDLEGRKVLITAGPTIEPIDPVRYITNRSSGKSGYALAHAAVRRGAAVTLVSGPVDIKPPKDADTVMVGTAKEMLDACAKRFDKADIAIFSAAVCDVSPKEVSSRKLKRQSGELDILELEENPDILATLASKSHKAVVVGYAAETSDVLQNAKAKLASKGADLIVANDVSGDLGFDTDDNKVWICSEDSVDELPVMSKARIADRILDAAARLL